MFKRFVTAVSLLLGVQVASAQTLFTYGKDSVTVGEFLRAFQKNNAAAGVASNAGLTEYLDLYITARLKVAEAKALGYDTLPHLVEDLQALRGQLLPTYLNDEESLDRLVTEAYARQQKEIRLSHIFIATPFGSAASEAQKRASEAYTLLQKGAPFAEVARNYSDDPSVKANGGDLGYITAFSLPYELENLAYSTPSGKLSTIYRSKAGYHIFKNGGERKALGRVQVAQILVAFPPGARTADSAAAKKTAAALYGRLLKGASFGKLAAQYSNDVVSAASDGMVGDIGIGEYDPAFERVAFSLTKDGEISRPFATAYGWHILKRIKRIPPPAGASEAATKALRQKVEGSDRMVLAREAFAQKVVAQLGYTKAPLSDDAIWAYTDSLLEGKAPATPTGIGKSTVLATVAGLQLNATDWINYARTFRFQPNGSGAKPFEQVWKEFIQTTSLDYYRDHLEKFNPAFRTQIEEFREGSLFFEIMQRKVWGPAQSDTAALQAFFSRNRGRYNWKPSADAVLFYAADAGTGAAAVKELAKSPSQWKAISARYGDKLGADSGRFELEALPNPGRAPLKEGTLTALQVNKGDGTASFAYILRRYEGPAPRTFEEAKGLVLNDYQESLEAEWVNALRVKYPVSINQPVLLELLKKK